MNKKPPHGAAGRLIAKWCCLLKAAALGILVHLRRRSATADSSRGEFARFKSATGGTRCSELCVHSGGPQEGLQFASAVPRVWTDKPSVAAPLVLPTSARSRSVRAFLHFSS